MEEDKRIKPGAKPNPQPAEKLVAKIAQAYSSLPAEERAKTLFSTSDTPVENPELDKTFNKLVETYSRRAPDRDRGKGVLHVFPGSAVPSLDQLTEETNEEESEGTPGAPSTPRAGSYECPECGHQNPADNRFCGRCGALYEAEGALEPASSRAVTQNETETEVTSKGVQHHHHYYHHHHQEQSKYLIALVLVLVAFIGWQQWETAKSLLKRATAPARPPATAPAPPVVAVDKGLQMPALIVTAPPPAAISTATAVRPKPAASVDPTKPSAAPGSFRPAVDSVPAPPRESQPAPAPAQVSVPANGGVEEPPSIAAVRNPLDRLLMPAVLMPRPGMPRASEGVVQGNLIHRVPPIYPPLAVRGNIEGTVVLSAKIAQDGSVVSVQPISGHPMLTAAAVAAVQQWKYKPYTVSGQPVEVETTISIEFRKHATPR